MADAQKRHHVIADACKVVRGARDAEERLAACDIILKHARALAKYEKRGIPTMKPPPSEVFRQYREWRDGLIRKVIDREASLTLAQMKTLRDPRQRVDGLTKVLLKIREAKKKTGAKHFDALYARVSGLMPGPPAPQATPSPLSPDPDA